jgi:hypothetical protein
MRVTTTLWFVSSIAAAFVIGRATATPVQRVAAMQQAPVMRTMQVLVPDAAPPGFNHLMCYQPTFQNPLPPTTVALQDQFYPSPFTTALGNPVILCTPTKKKLLNRRPIPVTPNGHFVCYPILQPPPPVNAVKPYTNQLENNIVMLKNISPILLCAPTKK